ncbi:MAG: NifU family protein [Phycisphaeraceae bacterium]|nr:NifU family protein [Phycisphaeraceae bacterium]
MAESNEKIKQRVAEVIEKIRPSIQADDGDIELVDVTPEGVAQIRFHGECLNCPSKPMTLQSGIETNIKAHVPEVTSVVAVD